jgi:hypothetical protein
MTFLSQSTGVTIKPAPWSRSLSVLGNTLGTLPGRLAMAQFEPVLLAPALALRLIGQTHRGDQQLVGCSAKGLGNSAEDRDRQVPLLPLNLADVRSIDLSVVRQLFLRQSRRLAHGAHVQCHDPDQALVPRRSLHVESGPS